MSIESILRRRWFKIAVDTALLVGFVTKFVTQEGPDYGFHSWVGIVLVPVITAHLVSNAGWIRRVAARRQNDRKFPLAVLNATLGLLASRGSALETTRSNWPIVAPTRRASSTPGCVR